MSGKILLVSANKYSVPYPVYPIGISFLSTYLSSKLPDHKVHIFDFLHENHESFIKHLNVFKPNYIGISLRNIDDVNVYLKQSFINDYKMIIRLIRKHSDAKIILGGSGYSIFPKTLFEHLNPDFGIFGEGEESFYKLIQALESKSDYSNIEGLVHSENNKICSNNRINYITNPELNYSEELIDFYWVDSGMLNVQSKRGCPYKCVYCTYPLIEGSKVRTLDTDKIIDTLSELYNKKTIDYIFFTDSIFNIHNSYNYELAEKIIASKIKIKWGAYFSPFNLNKELLRLLKKSGLTHIEFGTDSISEKQLDIYGKDFTVTDIMKTSKLCNELEIYFAHYLILGGIGETEETLNETFENSKKINKTVYYPFIGMRIYPGTKLEEMSIKESKIKKDEDLLEPKYYISDHIDLSTIKDRANKTGKKWIFPDDDMSAIMQKMRILDKKGPLWEYLLK